MFIAKGAMPDKYRERVSTEINGKIDIAERLLAGRKRLIEFRKNEDAKRSAG
jgi:hypothetical protein